MKRWLLFGAVAGALCALVALAGCAQQTEAENGSASGAPSSVEPNPSSGDAVVLDGQGGVEVLLDYNAGTGFEWVRAVEPEGVLGILRQETQAASDDKTTTGGPLVDVVTLMALEPGDATLTCELRRPWETDSEPAQVQTFVFSVDSDLQIEFDEAASSFANAPTQISFS